MEKVLEVRNIKKHFGSVKANDGIDFALRKGTVHAIVGENGAGKSTLMKVLYGLYQPDFGQIILDGEPKKIGSPQEAHRLGIGMVFQHFMLVDPLTVTENVILGVEPGSYGFINYAAAEAKVREVSERYNLRVDPKAKISSLSVGIQQRVEILKILFRKARFIILDEPTAVLTPQETRELFRIMQDLIQDGKSIIFITHKLNEVLEIADDITVIRDGRSMGSMTKEEATEQMLANMMVGRDVLLRVDKEAATPSEPVLTVKDLTTESLDRDQPVEGISFDVRAGEILGVVGVAGNGQDALVEALTGLRRLKSGKVIVNGHEITGWSPARIREAGVGHIPADRLKTGLVVDFSVQENILLGSQHERRFQKGLFLAHTKIQEYGRQLVQAFNIKTPSLQAAIHTLSGGNQQKVIIARELANHPKLVLAVQPTRGVDVGSIEMIHQVLLDQRRQGAAILLVSNELEEVLSLADRVAVLFRGKILALRETTAFTREEIGLLMAGVTKGGIS